MSLRLSWARAKASAKRRQGQRRVSAAMGSRVAAATACSASGRQPATAPSHARHTPSARLLPRGRAARRPWSAHLPPCRWTPRPIPCACSSSGRGRTGRSAASPSDRRCGAAAPVGAGRDGTVSDRRQRHDDALRPPGTDMNGLAPASEDAQVATGIDASPPSRRAGATRRSRSRPRSPWRCRRNRGRAASKSARHGASAARRASSHRAPIAPAAAGSPARRCVRRLSGRMRHRSDAASSSAQRNTVRRSSDSGLHGRRRVAIHARQLALRIVQRQRTMNAGNGGECASDAGVGDLARRRFGRNLDQRSEPELCASRDVTMFTHAPTPCRRSAAAGARLR